MSDLYEEVCAWYNLYMAWLRAARGKRGREPAARFEYHLNGYFQPYVRFP